MSLPPILANLPLPVIGSPMFIISTPELVIAQCKAGIVGTFPALNARPSGTLEKWIVRIKLEAHRTSTYFDTHTSRVDFNSFVFAIRLVCGRVHQFPRWQ